MGVAEAPLPAGEASPTVSQLEPEVSPVHPEAAATSSPPARAPPKSWADLVRTKATLPATTSALGEPGSPAHINGFSSLKAGSFVDVLSSFDASAPTENARIAFIEPRGLVNTGNMCYMNAVSDQCE